MDDVCELEQDSDGCAAEEGAMVNIRQAMVSILLLRSKGRWVGLVRRSGTDVVVFVAGGSAGDSGLQSGMSS